jgi:3-dehydroquinate synthase
MKSFIVQSGVQIFFGRGVLGVVRKLVAQRMAIIADAAVKDLLPGEVIAIRPEKTREMKAFLEDELFRRGFGRDTVLVAVGGGTITDLVGFVASTYMRGVPLILVPTTLLAMVDAAIGGKTGIDTPFGKNLIGSFYLPKAIVIDLDVLKSLPEREMMHGMSEILKIGLVHDPAILEMSGDEQILRVIQAKIAVVEKDPKEQGLRRILNFGHTIGHAIETCTGMAHGEAVAIGCVAESYLSWRMGFLSEIELQRIVGLFPKVECELSVDAIIQAMQLDKKRAKGKVRFVLLRKIGEAVDFDGDYCTEVPIEFVREAISTGLAHQI